MFLTADISLMIRVYGIKMDIDGYGSNAHATRELNICTPVFMEE